LGKRPFSEEERRQIASLCEEIFAGRFHSDSELAQEYGGWLPYIVHLYLFIYDSVSGDFRALPFPGSLMDQPHCTMEILRLIQLNYRISIKPKGSRE